MTGEVARGLATTVGGRDVRSVIATGNVLFRSSRSPRALERDLERACAEHYGRATEMVVKTASEWRALIAANPLAEMSSLAPTRVLVWAMRTPLPDAGLAQLRRRASATERVERTAAGDLYVYFDDQQTKLTAGFRLAALGAVGTNRNWNTARKITAALDEMERSRR